jgi:hypothetical protein
MKLELMTNEGAGNGADKLWPGGRCAFLADATWGGGNVKLQIKTDTGAYADVSNSTLSANGLSGVLYLPAGTYRAVATTASAVYAQLHMV